jgi:hypothetical protein
VIIKNVGKAVGAGTLVGANATTFAHGQICSVGQEPFGAGNGAVFYVGKTPPTEDAGLVNGTVYYYKAFAYDKADGNYPSDLVQMGRNYTSGVVAQAAPGLQPDAVTDFYAISRLAENEITLNWKNSNNPAKPQGGTVVWYTAKVDKWDQIPEDTTKWTNETAMTAIKLFAIQAKSGPEELLRLSQDASGTALTTKETYFFKAFAYNETGTPLTPADLLDPVKISSYRFSSGVKAAGAPTVGGLSLLSDKKAYRLKLKKKTGDFGINFVVFPFSPNDTIWCYNETTSKDDPVLMLTKLRDIIRDKGAKVITLGWWGPDQKPLGYIFNNDGKITWRKEGTPENFDGLKMIWNVPYQISVVDKDVEIILKNYSGAPEPGNIIEPGDVESGMSGGTSPGAP